MFFVWHYFNPRLPDLAGDYHGLSGVELTIQERHIETDVVVVWRLRDGRVAEVWDIPAVHAARTRAA